MFPKIKSILQLYDLLPKEEKLIVDVLRGIIIETIPHGKEKISFNVPYFYGNKGICIVWPASVPRGGIKKGVLLGFWYGKFLKDEDNYLTHGTNKQVFYKIYFSPEEIEEEPLIRLLRESVIIDNSWC